MRIRWIALAVMALVGLTAFAPAPFIKSGRDRNPGDVLAALQGTWSITEKQRAGPNGRLMKYSTAQKIRIEKDTWRSLSASEVNGGGVGGGKAKGFGRTSYKIELTSSVRPTEFRLKRTSGRVETDYMVGILQVDGDTVKLLYRLGSAAAFGGQVEDANPRGFDPVPEGWYLMTIKRDP
jgi:uncharacterized protein (TIGR03067 family)